MLVARVSLVDIHTKTFLFIPLMRAQLAQNGEKPVTKKEVNLVKLKANYRCHLTLHIDVITIDHQSSYEQNPMEIPQLRHQLAPTG